MSYVFGAIMNYISIIFMGEYNPVQFPDGDLMEDSSFYDSAFELAYCIGTIAGNCTLF